MHISHVVPASTLCLLVIAGMIATAAAGEKVLTIDRGKPMDKKTEERGRYIIKIAGCNDCHTAGYAEAAGKVPEKDWLKGDTIGWRGPWGTTYASNLRLSMQNLSEDQWIQVSRTVEFRPPMPWFALREMTEHDLRAIYRFNEEPRPSRRGLLTIQAALDPSPARLGAGHSAESSPR